MVIEKVNGISIIIIISGASIVVFLATKIHTNISDASSAHVLFNASVHALYALPLSCVVVNNACTSSGAPCVSSTVSVRRGAMARQWRRSKTRAVASLMCRIAWRELLFVVVPAIVHEQMSVRCRLCVIVCARL